MDDSGGPPHSYWRAIAPPLPDLPRFTGDAVATVAVVGAGFTGLSAALHLAEQGVDVVVLDAREPGWGASGRNNGQVVAALKHEPQELESRFGKERSDALIEAVGKGPDLVFGLIDRFNIDCRASRNGIITAARSERDLLGLRRRTDIWIARGTPLRLLTPEETASKTGTGVYRGACLDPRGGSINPLAYARGLAAAVLRLGGGIFTHALVQKITRHEDRWVLQLDQGRITAERVIIGTNAHTGPFWPGLAQTILPVRTPQLVSKPLTSNLRRKILPDGQVMSDTRALTVGVRMHPDGRLHLGGGGGTARGGREKLFKQLAAKAGKMFPFLPDLEWEFQWTGVMAITPDRYPRLFDLAPGVAASLGYSGRGVAMATIMGRELARWATGEAPLDQLALPVSRFAGLPYHRAKEFFIEAGLLYYAAKDQFHQIRH
jgi:glycine/D-amino acid oxidase-like deaminating enzyme